MHGRRTTTMPGFPSSIGQLRSEHGSKNMDSIKTILKKQKFGDNNINRNWDQMSFSRRKFSLLFQFRILKTWRRHYFSFEWNKVFKKTRKHFLLSSEVFVCFFVEINDSKVWRGISFLQENLPNVQWSRSTDKHELVRNIIISASKVLLLWYLPLLWSGHNEYPTEGKKLLWPFIVH